MPSTFTQSLDSLGEVRGPRSRTSSKTDSVLQSAEGGLITVDEYFSYGKRLLTIFPAYLSTALG